MSDPHAPPSPAGTPPFLPPQNALTKALLHATDWARTPLGPMETWPRSLRHYVWLILELPSPAIIFWGPQQTQIYNDGYAVIMGPRHPRYFGAPYRESWPDTYPLIYPWMRRVLDHGEVVEVRQEHIPVTRYGFEEDAYFTFTFSPLRNDDGAIAGILQPVFEVTDTVLSERRSRTLRALVPPGSLDPVADALAALQGNPGDAPFAQVYLWEAAAQQLARAGATGGFEPDANRQAALDAAARQALDRRASQLLDEAAGGRVLLLPLEDVASPMPRGVLAVGLSPRLHLDDRYRAFLESAAAQLATALQRAALLQAQERQRRQLHELFLQVPAGIAVLQGPEHVFELVNPVYQAVIGPRDVIGLPLRQALPELQDQAFPRILDEVRRSGQAHVGMEEPARLHRGPGGSAQEVFINYVYQPLHDTAGRPSGILVFVYEVTEQVRARQRAEALSQELREEHRRKDDFLAMLAHELRNPLAPISTAAEVLRRGQLDEARVRATSEVIARQVRHMTGMVNDLLDVSRVTRGLVSIERLPQDLREVVADAVEQVRPLVLARRHRLTLSLPEEPACVAGDSKRLVQVVANLLNNAARYTPEGGDIALVVALEPDAVTVAVRDSGIGIEPALQAQVFGLFVQAERSTDRAQGGLGVGLALVRSIVELHGGTVACASQGPGSGSEFTVRLPRLQAGAADGDAAQAALPAPAMPAAAPRHVLIVDDNRDAARMLALQLRGVGHRVEVEHDPQQALVRARRTPPEVCLLDIGLPGMSGIELARHLRALPGTAHALLVAITGYGQLADRQRALDAGFDAYLVKPPDLPQLAALLARGPRPVVDAGPPVG